MAIIGSGPAGLSAAINAKIRNKNIILFGNKNISNKLTKAPLVKNYLGFYDITGEELKKNFKNHIEKMNIEINESKITGIYAMGKYFSILSGNEMFEADSIVLATGIEFTKQLKGEEEFLGRGVGYCATCDAPLYKGKKVAIIGYNDESVDEANYLNELASKTYFIPMYPKKKKIEDSAESVNANSKEKKLDSSVELINDKPTEILGNMKVSEISFKNSENIDVDGVFIIKDNPYPHTLMPGIETKEGHILVDTMMRTNIKGCFAAGDCVGKPYSYIKAAGQGQIAALSAVEYLDNMK
ncbi:MAG: NAD(P)/FAD-dependent oxidoreductase [Clostridioides sp.]|jgi:thioredoxin reductase (NADPH)|nr:NAD(P)/FAD-dependent oxidoreductase [Clostridioides sp.]